MRYSLSLTLVLTLFLTTMGTAAALDRASQHEAKLGEFDAQVRAKMEPVRSGSCLMPAEFSDIQISTTESPARFDQDNARVLSLGAQGWLVVWDDDRFGSGKIFWQQFDTLGVVSGTNEVLAGSSEGNVLAEPLIAVDTLDRLYLFYRDQTGGMIHGRRYDENLQIDLADFLVNDTSGNAFAGLFDFAVFPDGQVIIVWEDYSTGGSTIQMRLYSPAGTSIVGPVAVNTDGGDDQHWEPSVAVAPGSGYVVAWEDYRNGRADIYARQFTGSGVAVGAEFPLVAPPDDASAQYAPAIAYSPKDRYVIGWADRRVGQEIYLQRFSQTSGLHGANQRLSSGDTLVTNWDLDLSVNPAGQLYAVWADFGITNRILGLALDSALVPDGQAVTKNGSGFGRRWAPATDFDAVGTYAMVWTEFSNDQADIHLMLYDSADVPLLGSEPVVNDDLAGAESSNPFIAAANRFSSLVCFTDKRNDAGDIMVRAISRVGQMPGLDHKVNQDLSSALQSEPSSAGNDATSLIVWIDARIVGGFSGQRVYGRFASSHGWFSDNEFMISDTVANAVKAAPRVALAADGQALVAWVDNRDGSAQVWGRWLDAAGSIDGDEFAISAPATDSSATDLSAGVDSSGHFCVAWLDIGLSIPAAKVVWYNSNKTEGDRFAWASTVPSVVIDEFSAAVHPTAEVTLFWTGQKLGVRNAYLTQLNSDGSVAVAPFVLTDDTLANVSDPAVAVDGNGYVVTTWEDRREGRRAVYYQRTDPALSPVGSNAAISAAAPEFMATPSVDAHYGWGWFAWADPRSDGLNIYASAINYDPTDIDPEPGDNLPSSFRLFQNYPNPFNPETVISFYLPERQQITLEVFNVRGQKVKSLAAGEYPAGENSVRWDGTNEHDSRVASGVYLYRLSAGKQTESRKMMLLK